MADGFDRIARIRGGQQAPQTSNDAQFEAYRAAVNAANQASQQQGPPQGWRQANGVERLLHGSGQFGESLGNIFGSREAWEEVKQARQDGSGLFGSIVNFLPRFAADLPGNMLGIPFMAPEKLGEVVSGSPMQEIQNGYIPDYELNTEQRLATLGDVGIDLLGLAFGGSRTALRMGRNMMRGMGNETLLDAATSTSRWQNGLSTPRRIAWDVTEEAGEEFAQQYLQEIRGDQEKHGVEALDDQSLDRALEGAFLGALGGGIFSGGSLAVEKGLGYAGDRAKKWTTQGQSADEKVAMDVYTPWLKQTVQDMGSRDTEYVSQEAEKRIQEANAKNERHAGIANVKFSSIGARTPGRVEHVPMADIYESMVSIGNEGQQAKESVLKAFNIAEAADAGLLQRYGISSSENADSVITGLISRGGASMFTVHEIFETALEHTKAQGKDVEIVIAKNPHHNGGLYKLAVDSIILDNGKIIVDAQTAKKLNADADGDDAVITFLESIEGYSPRRGILHMLDDTGRNYSALEQLGLYGIESSFDPTNNPMRFIENIIANHNEMAENPNSNLKKIEGKQREQIVRAVKDIEDAIIKMDDEGFAHAFESLKNALMGKYDGSTAYNASDSRELDDEAERLVATDLQTFMRMICDNRKMFREILDGTVMAAEDASEAKSEAKRKADEDIEKNIGGGIPKRVSDKTRTRVISAAKSNIDASIISIYHWIRGFSLDLDDSFVNPIFRAMFELVQQRKSLVQTHTEVGNVIQRIAVEAMGIRSLGQEKSDQITSLFNTAVAMETRRLCEEKGIALDFAPGMDWGGFEEAFTEAYNDIAKIYNNEIYSVMDGKRELAKAEYAKNIIGEDAFTVYDAVMSVYGETIMGPKSFTRGLSLNEFSQYRYKPARAIRTFADETIPDIENAPNGTPEMLNKFVDGIESAWNKKRESVYGRKGSIVKYLGAIGDSYLADYARRYVEYGPDGMSEAELDVLYKEILKIFNAIVDIIGYDPFFDKTRKGLLRTARDFLAHKDFFELMTRDPGNVPNYDLGWERLGFLSTIFMQSKFKHEMQAINNAKNVIADADLSDGASKLQAIAEAKKWLEFVRVSLAQSANSNRFTLMFFDDIAWRISQNIDTLDETSSAAEISEEFNNMDLWIKYFLNPEISLDDKLKLLGVNTQRSSQTNAWVADMLAPPRAIAGDMGIGNKLKKARQQYSDRTGHLCKEREIALLQCKDVMKNLHDNSRGSQYTSDEFMIITRDVCENLETRDKDVFIASMIDVELLTGNAQEKAKSMPGASMLSQSQAYIDGQPRTSYMNNMSVMLNETDTLTIDQMCSDHQRMTRLVFGPRSISEANEDRWFVGDPANGIDYTLWTCELFYREHLGPEFKNEIDAAMTADGYFSPTPDLFVKLVERFPEVISMISPKRLQVALDPDGHPMLSTVPVYKNIGGLISGALEMRGSGDTKSSEDIIWKHVGSMPGVQYLWQSAISPEKRSMKPTVFSAAAETAYSQVRTRVKNMMLYLRGLKDRPNDLRKAKEDIKRDILMESARSLYVDMERQLGINRKIEDQMSMFLTRIMLGLHKIIETKTETAIAGKTISEIISQSADIEENVRLDVDEIIKHLDNDMMADNGQYEIWSGQIENMLINSIRHKMLQKWALKQWYRTYADLFDLERESFEDKFDSAKMQLAIRNQVASTFASHGVVLTPDQLDRIMSTKAFEGISGRIDTIVHNAEANAIKGLGSSSLSIDMSVPDFEATWNNFISWLPSAPAGEYSSFRKFIKDSIKSGNEYMLSKYNMEYSNLPPRLRTKIETADLYIIEYMRREISEEELRKQIEPIIKEFNFERATWTINAMSSDYNIERIATSTVSYSQQVSTLIDTMYETLDERLSDREREWLDTGPDAYSVDSFQWNLPLHIFDVVSQTQGATGANYEVRGYVEAMTGIAGNFPKTYASFMYLRDAPNHIILNNLDWQRLLAYAYRGDDIDFNDLDNWLSSRKERDFFKVDVILDDAIMEYLGSRVPDSLSKGDIFTLNWRDIPRLYQVSVNTGSQSSSFQISGGSPNEVMNGVSAHDNEGRILKAQKKANSMSDITGSVFLKKEDKLPPENINFVSDNVDPDARMDMLLSSWNSFMQKYGMKVLDLAKRNAVDAGSPLVLERWVLKHFVPRARLKLDHDFAASMNIPNDEISVSYEQVHRASSKFGNAVFDKLGDSDLIGDAGVLKFRTKDPVTNNPIVVVIPPDKVVSANIDIMSADAVSLRLIKISHDLAETWGTLSDEEKSNYGNSPATYIHRNFAEKYIDWSPETFRKMAADDWRRASRPAVGFTEDPASVLYSKDTWMRFLDEVQHNVLGETDREAKAIGVAAFDPIWNMEKVNEYRNKTDSMMGYSFAYITNKPSSDQREIPRDVLTEYNDSLLGMYNDNASPSSKDSKRKIVVSANGFLASDYLMPRGSNIILEYIPDSATLQNILLKCVQSNSGIWCTDRMAKEITDNLLRVGNAYAIVEPIRYTHGPNVNNEEYNNYIPCSMIYDVINGSPSKINAGMIKITNIASGEGNESKYKSADQPRHNVFVTNKKRNPFLQQDSGVLFTYDMAMNYPAKNVDKTVTYTSIGKYNSNLDILEDASMDDLEALFNAISDMRTGEKIDIDKLTFESKNGEKYRLDLSGMSELGITESAKLDRIAGYADTINSFSKMKMLRQNDVCLVAKYTMADGTIALCPIAATKSVATSENMIVGYKYGFNSVDLQYMYTWDMFKDLSRAEWLDLINNSPESVKLYLLDIFHKGINEATSGTIDTVICGRDAVIWGVIDGPNSIYSKVQDGYAFDRVVMVSLFDNLVRLSGHKPGKYDPYGDGIGFDSWISFSSDEELPGGITTSIWNKLMNADRLDNSMISHWYNILAQENFHFTLAGEKFDPNNADDVKFDRKMRLLVADMLDARINPKIIFNPTDGGGWWTGLDSYFIEKMFSSTISCDDLFFIAWYITKDDVYEGGKKFCVKSSSDLFEDDYNAWVNSNLSEFIFDGLMRTWRRCENVRNYNGMELMHVISTDISTDDPAGALGSLSTKSAISDQIGMATSWQTGKGPIAKWADRLYDNAMGLSRDKAISVLSKHSHMQSDFADYSVDEEGDLPWLVPDNAPRINLSDYVDPGSIEIPFVVTRDWLPTKVLEELDYYDDMAKLYQLQPDVYEAKSGRANIDNIESDKELRTRYFAPLKKALGANNVSWHDMCLLIQFLIGWTPDTNGGKLVPISALDFQLGFDKIIERANQDKGRILAIERLVSKSSKTGVRYSLGIGTKEIAGILAKCENAYTDFKGSEAERAQMIYNEIGSRKAINTAVRQLSPLASETNSDSKGQYEALKKFINFVMLDGDYEIMEIFDSAGRSVTEDDLTQRDFIDKVYKYGRFDQDRYLAERKAAQDRKLAAMDSVRSEMGKEIIPEDSETRGRVITRRRAARMDVERFFDNGTLLARLMGLLNPMITVMSGIDKAISYKFDDVLLGLGKQGRGPYKSYSNGIELKEDTIRDFCSDPNVIDFMTALQLARYNGDLNTFIARMVAGQITPKQYLAELDKQGNRLERAFRKVAKIATAEFMMRGKRAENFIRYFAKMSADEGHTWLASKRKVGDEEISELEWLLRGPDKVNNLAKLFYDPNAASDLVAQRALNLTLRADLAQDLAVSVAIESLVRRNGAINFGIAMACTPFLKANIAFAHRALGHVMPCCTINYLLATRLGQSEALKKFNPNIEADMDRARLYSSLREAALVDVMNIGLGALAFMLAGCAFLEPPDDDDKWCNWEEWTLMGYRLDTEWWINDILGVALPIACFWKSAALGKATPQILFRGLQQVVMDNPVSDVGELMDMVFNPNGYMESLEEGLEYYEDYPMGAPDGMEAFFASIPAVGLSWLGKLITPSLFREISRLAPQYETSYNQIWEESATGALTEEGAQGKTQKTTFLDSRIRKVTKNNVVLGALLDLLPIDTQTSYIGSKMPRQRIYDENQMNWMTEFSVVDEDGNPKSAEEQEQVVSEIILMLQCTDDMDALYHDGFYLNSQTREACSKYIWDMYHDLTNQWETWRANGDLDFYVLGNGDFEAGSEKYGEMKLAYNQSRENLMSLYYDKLWSKELNQGLVVYNRYNTTWRQDINGNWYASGEQEKLGGLLSPLNKAPGTLEDPGITTGYENDWGTPSYVTGQSMYDENGNAMRALVPTVENELDVPSLDSWGEDRNNGYSSNYGTVYNTGATSTNNDNGSNNDDNGSTSYPNRGTSGTRRYSSGGGGGYGSGGSAPYSHVSAYGPNNNSIKQSAPNDGTRIYEANLDYLRPSFETKGSREAYRREDL